MSRQSIVLEVLRAVCVLALLFLNFAHQPVSVKSPADDVLSVAQTLSFCGAPLADDRTPHAPCHACRIGGAADLPPPPDLPAGPCIVADVAYGAIPVLVLPVRIIGPQSARGPPALV